MHRVLIGLLGMPIGELWHLDPLAAACAPSTQSHCVIASAVSGQFLVATSGQIPRLCSEFCGYAG